MTDAPNNGAGNTAIRWWKGLSEKGRRIAIGVTVAGVALIGIIAAQNRADPDIENCVREIAAVNTTKADYDINKTRDWCVTSKELSEGR